jgi:hypothetical protein
VGSTSGGSGSADRARIAVRNGGTYVVGVGAWATPENERPCSAGCRPAPEENPREEDQETAEEDLLFSPLEEDPPEEDRTFKPADSLHFQNGDDTEKSGVKPAAFVRARRLAQPAPKAASLPPHSKMARPCSRHRSPAGRENPAATNIE